MNLRRLARIVCLVLLTFLVMVPLLMADDGMDRERDLTRVRKKVEALRAWQLSEELDLDEDTSARLFPAMKKADQERWQIEASNRELVKEMARALESRKPDSNRINRILDELQANRRELIRAEERHLERVRQILSPADTARYLMFQIRFQREIKQRAAEAIRDRRQSGDRSDKGSRDRNYDRDQGSGGYGDDGSGSSGGGGSSDGGGSSGGGGSGGRR